MQVKNPSNSSPLPGVSSSQKASLHESLKFPSLLYCCMSSSTGGLRAQTVMFCPESSAFSSHDNWDWAAVGATFYLIPTRIDFSNQIKLLSLWKGCWYKAAQCQLRHLRGRGAPGVVEISRWQRAISEVSSPQQGLTGAGWEQAPHEWGRGAGRQRKKSLSLKYDSGEVPPQGEDSI